MDNNPLLSNDVLPRFSAILPEHIEPAIKEVIAKNRAELTRLLSSAKTYTWENLLLPLEEMHDRLSHAFSPASHLHSVLETENLRAAYNNCLPLITEYSTELMQNEILCKAVHSIAEGDDYRKLNAMQHKLIENELRDFRLAGVDLPPEKKARFAELQKQLSQLTTKFSENLLDATQAWTLPVTDINALGGLPEQAIKAAQQNAEQHGKEGWLFSLDYPSYSAAIKYLDNRELRWLMYQAYVTRASDQGPNAGQFDNTKVMEDILALRHELAQLVDFANYAEYSLVTKMAKKPDEVLHFLYDLGKRAKPIAEHELAELKALALADGITTLESWDTAYYSEKLRQQKFSLTPEELRPYFPIDKVLQGLFTLVNRLYGISIQERHGIDVWHPQVQYFEIYDVNDVLRGGFYTDLYARPHKREGAWMDECRIRRRLSNGKIQNPVAFLTCNFSRPLGDKPALLTHEDVLTLFHEFGHCLHHLMTQVEYLSLSGINGVPWDVVEFPSQFMEYWAWERDVVNMISGHVDTQERLPDTLYTKLLASKHFQAGLATMRQIEFAIFDFRLHLEYKENSKQWIQTILDQIRDEIAVIKPPKFNRFQHSFSHVFAGGYAAGYYSYKWAEVLASDAFALFEENGLLDRKTGQAFVEKVLAVGGSLDPLAMFVAFRGREPTLDALLRHSGLVVHA